jgi:cytochrome c-type biogenesis protein CcmH
VNAESSVDWIPGLAILAGGLVFGAVLVWRLLGGSRRPAKARAFIAVEARDLAGKSEALLRQLRELEDTASKRNPEQLARERYALELEAARALLALEQKGGSVMPPEKVMPARKGAPAAGAAPAEPHVRPSVRGFLWGVGSAAGVALLGILVYQAAQPREPGGSVTGNTPMTSRPAGGTAAQGEESELQAALARNPEDLDAHLALARLYVGRENWMGVWNETARVLERAPGNPPALAYQSLVRLAMGQTDMAVTMLTKALTADPDLIDGYVYLALTYSRMGRMRDAEATVAKASKRFPDRAAEFQKFLADLRKQELPMAQSSTAPAAANANPHAGLDAPGDAPPAPVRSAGPRVSGTVDVDPSLRSKLPSGGILFVFARAAGAREGPPVAVKRLPARFPAAFELSEADSMMGQPLPEKLLIEARLDEDGDPTTRPPSDPKARLDGVKLGRADVHLVLKRP